MPAIKPLLILNMAKLALLLPAEAQKRDDAGIVSSIAELGGFLRVRCVATPCDSENCAHHGSNIYELEVYLERLGQPHFMRAWRLGGEYLTVLARDVAAMISALPCGAEA